MRSIIRGILIADSDLTDIIPANRWFASGSIDDDNTPATPFAVIRFGLVNRGMAHVQRGSVTIWIHDGRGSYSNIDAAMRLITGILDGREHVSDGDSELIKATWQDTSGDLFDNGYRTLTKTTTYEIVGTGV
jgi:hypothetical protein